MGSSKMTRNGDTASKRNQANNHISAAGKIIKNMAGAKFTPLQTSSNWTQILSKANQLIPNTEKSTPNNHR